MKVSRGCRRSSPLVGPTSRGEQNQQNQACRASRTGCERSSPGRIRSRCGKRHARVCRTIWAVFAGCDTTGTEPTISQCNGATWSLIVRRSCSGFQVIRDTSSCHECAVSPYHECAISLPQVRQKCVPNTNLSTRARRASHRLHSIPCRRHLRCRQNKEGDAQGVESEFVIFVTEGAVHGALGRRGGRS